jgi:hypothetical protein
LIEPHKQELNNVAKAIDALAACGLPRALTQSHQQRYRCAVSLDSVGSFQNTED